MKHAWFRQWGWVYRPVSFPGWVVVVLAFMFCVNVFIAVDRHSHSVSDTMYGIFPYVIPTFGIVGWIASRTAGREG